MHIRNEKKLKQHTTYNIIHYYILFLYTLYTSLATSDHYSIQKNQYFQQLLIDNALLKPFWSYKV